MQTKLVSGPALLKAEKSSLVYSYINASIATFWIYDYIITLDDEITFYRECKRYRIKTLYIAARIFPFLLIASLLFDEFSADTSQNCLYGMIYAYTICDALTGLSADALFSVRVYAMWNRSRRVLALLIASSIILLITTFTTVFVNDRDITYVAPATSAVVGCSDWKGDNLPVVPYVVWTAFQLVLVILTLVRALKVQRETGSKLLQMLIQHNVFYFASACCFASGNAILIPVELFDGRRYLTGLMMAIQATLSTRMHRSLWMENHRRTQRVGCDSTAGETDIPLTELSRN